MFSIKLCYASPTCFMMSSIKSVKGATGSLAATAKGFSLIFSRAIMLGECKIGVSSEQPPLSSLSLVWCWGEKKELIAISRTWGFFVPPCPFFHETTFLVRSCKVSCRRYLLHSVQADFDATYHGTYRTFKTDFDAKHNMLSCEIIKWKQPVAKPS